MHFSTFYDDILLYNINYSPLESQIDMTSRLALGLTAALLAGCATMPLSSRMALRHTDPATTDAVALQAAIDMPQSLRPLPGTIRLVLTAIDANGGRRSLEFPLQEDAAATALAARDNPPRPMRRLLGYRLPPAELERFQAMREAMRQQQPPVRGLTLGVAADACRAGPIGVAPLHVTTLLRTAETERHVEVARLDLRRLVGAAIDALPACNG